MEYYIHGKVFTSRDDLPWAEAFSVEGGRIRQVGREKEVLAGRKEGERVFDLKGRTVIPGLIDSHMHPAQTAEFRTQITCLPPRVCSIADLQREIRAVRASQGPDRWVRGWGFDDGKLAEGRVPDRHDLDEGADDVPVYITRNCGHVVVANSRALAACGITAETPDPDGGAIGREADGKTPNGILYENARELVDRVAPPLSVPDAAKELVKLGRLLSAEGIVGVTEMGDEGADVLSIYPMAAEMGYKQKTAMYLYWEYYKDDPAFSLRPEDFDREKQVRVAGLKLLSDGSVSGHTAWVREPFLGTEDCGISVTSDETLDSAIAFCKAHACQLAVHAMGARAIERITRRVAMERKWMTGAPHARLEHVTEPEPDSIRRMKEQGMAVATQPLFFFSEIESYRKNYGLERTRRAYPIRTLLENGIPVGLSTDSPANAWEEPTDPFYTMQAAVTRVAYDGTDCGREQAVDVETAVRLYTRESAAISGFDSLGTLEPGKSASFVVLDRDIFTVPGEEIGTVRPLLTFIDGERVFSAEE